jgi:hypothetical protein
MFRLDKSLAAYSDCKEAKRKLSPRSRLSIKTTEALQRLQYPSKRITGLCIAESISLVF